MAHHRSAIRNGALLLAPFVALSLTAQDGGQIEDEARHMGFHKKNVRSFAEKFPGKITNY